MSLAQIVSFVTVAETRSVTSASARLRVAQPALSRQIKSLEDELGATLFERTPKGMSLLPDGEVFLEHARRILADVEAAKTSLRKR
jgi:DNA-binding transcriptional LysR family regulator